MFVCRLFSWLLPNLFPAFNPVRHPDDCLLLLALIGGTLCFCCDAVSLGRTIYMLCPAKHCFWISPDIDIIVPTFKSKGVFFFCSALV